jgi:hypothetical protein
MVVLLAGGFGNTQRLFPLAGESSHFLEQSCLRQCIFEGIVFDLRFDLQNLRNPA